MQKRSTTARRFAAAALGAACLAGIAGCGAGQPIAMSGRIVGDAVIPDGQVLVAG